MITLRVNVPLWILVPALLAGTTVACAPAEEATEAPVLEPLSEPTSAVLEGGGLTLTPMTDSPSYEGADLSVDREPGSIVSAGDLTLHFDVQNYELGVQTEDAATKGVANSGKGQHIHLIVDNGPYSAHYEPRAEIELEAGGHVILAFLSRSYHESVKSAGAAVLTDVVVGDSESAGFDYGGQHLFYSRPKGTYVGADSERLMLDFYLLNTELSATGNKVRATVNGVPFLLTDWVPYVIEGLPMGEVEITLELIDAAGEIVPGPFNSVTRSVKLEPAAD